MNSTYFSPKLIGEFCASDWLRFGDLRQESKFLEVTIGFENWAHSLILPNLVQCAPWILHRSGKQLAYHQLIIISIIILLV